jgi:hypothetical protein
MSRRLRVAHNGRHRRGTDRAASVGHRTWNPAQAADRTDRRRALLSGRTGRVGNARVADSPRASRTAADQSAWHVSSLWSAATTSGSACMHMAACHACICAYVCVHSCCTRARNLPKGAAIASVRPRHCGKKVARARKAAALPNLNLKFQSLRRIGPACKE